MDFYRFCDHYGKSSDKNNESAAEDRFGSVRCLPPQLATFANSHEANFVIGKINLTLPSDDKNAPEAASKEVFVNRPMYIYDEASATNVAKDAHITVKHDGYFPEFGHK